MPRAWGTAQDSQTKGDAHSQADIKTFAHGAAAAGFIFSTQYIHDCGGTGRNSRARCVAYAILRSKERTLSTDTSAVRTKAEANFKKEERAKDGAKAMMEYLAQNAATREKTARLRALRLAQETAKASADASAQEPANASAKELRKQTGKEPTPVKRAARRKS
jgi:hypothetical protein